MTRIKHRIALPGLILLCLAGAAARGAAPETAGEPRRAWNGSALVPVRSAAAADAPQMARLAPDTPVSLLPGGDGQTCEIVWQHLRRVRHGYIACAYLRPDGAAQTQAAPVEAAPQAAPAKAGKPDETPAAAAPASGGEPRRARNGKDLVPVRSGAAADAPQMARLAPDTPVNLLPGGDGQTCEIVWQHLHRVRHGYIACAYLQPDASAAAEVPAAIPAAPAGAAVVPKARDEAPAAAAATPAAGGTRRIGGDSLVAVLRAAAADAPVAWRLPPGTEVAVQPGDDGQWCRISWRQGVRYGFVPCARLEGGAPAAEAIPAAVAAAPAVKAPPEPAAAGGGGAAPALDASAFPLRMFWDSPDIDTFLTAGHYLDLSLLDERELQAEHPGLVPPAEAGTAPKADTAQPPRRHGVPAFEAMKRKLAEGLNAPHELWQAPLAWSRMLEIAAGAKGADAGGSAPTIGIEYLVTYPQIPLAPAQASYFKSLEEVGRPSANARQLSAQFPDSPYVTHVAGPAHWVRPRHGAPWVYGAWDAGALDIHLKKPAYQLVLERDGQLSVRDTAAGTRLDAAAPGPGCARPAAGRWRFSLGTGAAGPGDSAYPVVLLRTAAALDLAQAKVDSREVKLAARPKGRHPFQRGTLTTVDLDGDGKADVALWDGYRPLLKHSGAAQLLYRMVLVNVAGTWYVLDSDNWNDCE